jgi:hypothetical protein
MKASTRCLMFVPALFLALAHSSTEAEDPDEPLASEGQNADMRGLTALQTGNYLKAATALRQAWVMQMLCGVLATWP